MNMGLICSQESKMLKKTMETSCSSSLFFKRSFIIHLHTESANKAYSPKICGTVALSSFCVDGQKISSLRFRAGPTPNLLLLSDCFIGLPFLFCLTRSLLPSIYTLLLVVYQTFYNPQAPLSPERLSGRDEYFLHNWRTFIFAPHEGKKSLFFLCTHNLSVSMK